MRGQLGYSPDYQRKGWIYEISDDFTMLPFGLNDDYDDYGVFLI